MFGAFSRWAIVDKRCGAIVFHAALPSSPWGLGTIRQYYELTLHVEKRTVLAWESLACLRQKIGQFVHNVSAWERSPVSGRRDR